MIYHSGPLQQSLERLGAGHLPTKGGARGGRSPSIIVRMRSLRARTRGIGAAPAFTSSRRSSAICVVGRAETNLWPEIARRNDLGMLNAAVKRILRTPIPPSGVRFQKPWRPCWGFSFGMQMPAESRTSILARLRTENEKVRQELANALRRIAVLEAELAEARATVERLRMARCRGSE
jgi:hypothetical protein